MKIKWKVAPEPTGQYRSFANRAWPSAETEQGHVIGLISCDDQYTPRAARTGEHAPLKVSIRFGNPPEDRAARGGFVWRSLNARFNTLTDAKLAFHSWVEHNPNHDWGL